MFFQPVCAVIQDDDKHTKINLFLSVAICFSVILLLVQLSFMAFLTGSSCRRFRKLTRGYRVVFIRQYHNINQIKMSFRLHLEY